MEQNPQQTKSEKPQAHQGIKKKGERHWYAIHTYSGYEDAVARYLRQRVNSLSMNDKIFNIIVPKEKKVKIKNGKRKIVEEKIYHGYVLVDMTMSEDSWYVVRNTPRVLTIPESPTIALWWFLVKCVSKVRLDSARHAV